MKKSFLLVLLCMLASVLPAQKKMYVWVNEVPTEYSVSDVDSVTFADTEPTPVPTEPVFSVSEDKQVQFSTGNLQYTRSTQTWSFAAQQYETIGKGNILPGSQWADKTDVFKWSGSTGPNQWGIDRGDCAGSFADWGQNIGDGTTWRTLTKDEWTYLFDTRANASTLMGVARINFSEDGSKYANGLILLPDNWQTPEGVTFKSGLSYEQNIQAYADYQTFTLEEWNKLETAGAVFLPASGFSDANGVFRGHMNNGYYWSATPHGTYNAYYASFNSQFTNTSFSNSRSSYNYAVRLVKDVE